uniref:CARD- and ANK-containing Inflammasome Adaptor Protein n=1 Tax=Myripristis murdjan TaxID=586833 RepID=A0A667Z0Q4_9TELE
MISVLKGLQNAQSASNTTNPYAVDVIKAKRRDLIYGISHTEELLDLLVTEGAMTAAKRSIVLTIRTREEQNSRVLDILVARGERACRKFFHPCLMLAEPRLYQRIKAYVGSVNESIGDTRRQLIGYLLERDELEMSKMTDQTAFQKTYNSLTTKERKTQKEDGCTVPISKSETLKAAQKNPEKLFSVIELLNNIDTDTVNSSSETLLHVAAEHGRLSVIKLLLHKGARLDLQDSNGHTALHRAASRGHTEVVRLLQGGADPGAQDRLGRTALHWAASAQGQNPAVDLLLSARANPNTTDREKKTALHLAATQGNTHAVTSLLSHKVKGGTKDMDDPADLTGWARYRTVPRPAILMPTDGAAACAGQYGSLENWRFPPPPPPPPPPTTTIRSTPWQKVVPARMFRSMKLSIHLISSWSFWK